MDRHDRPVGDRLATAGILSPTDHLEVQRTLAALGEARRLVAFPAHAPPPASPGACDETLALRLARCLRLVMRLAP